MNFKEEIEGFRIWATSLGCPPDALPSEEALKSIFKSGKNNVLKKLQKRIHPRQYVEEVHENLLISQVANQETKLVPISGRSFMPRQVQTLLKMQDLQKEKETGDLKLAEARKEYDSLAAAIKKKNIQRIIAKHKNELHTARYNMLQLKLQSLNKNYEQELKIKEQIIATMPVKLSNKNASEKLAAKAVDRALKELEAFYDISNSDDINSHQLAEAKPRLWSKMREIFADTPCGLVFNAIIKSKDEQLHHIWELNRKPRTTEGPNVARSKPPLNNFEVKLLKTKADLLGLVAKYVNAKNEVAQLEERFVPVYSSFMDELQSKVNNFNGINTAEDNEAAEEIISDFIIQLNLRNFNQARNDFLTEQVEKLRMELEANAKNLENHEIMIGSIKHIYGEINTSVNRIQTDMLQLSQIKEKILYSKNTLSNLLEDMNQNVKSQLVSTKLKGNMSLLGMESFSLANDSVLSSTKVGVMDDDAANISGVANCTLQRSFDNMTLTPAGATLMVPPFAPGSNVPCHLLELNTFANIPMERFSSMSPACSFLLSANPLIVDSQELTSTIQLAPGYLLTPYGALQEVRKRSLWASAIAAHTSDLKLNLEPLIVDPHDLKLKARRQHEEIVQLLDNIEALGLRGHHQLEKAERNKRFILDNPCRKYVPPTRRYNNGTYADYESEFILYYRIATAGGTIKPRL